MSVVAILGAIVVWRGRRRRKWANSDWEQMQEAFRAASTAVASSKLRLKPADDDEHRRRRAFFRDYAKRCGLLGGGVRFVHVAGTNGKGSVCEFMRSALTHSGLRVAMFTSPHLHTPCERIRISDDLIPEADFIRLATALRPVFQREGEWMVPFDRYLTLALTYFGESAVDTVILETGIGGRFDSTNFLEAPALSVITSISFDHEHILGRSLPEIAGQKAGIIKSECPIISPWTQHPDVKAVLDEEALRQNTMVQYVCPGKAGSGASSASSGPKTGNEVFQAENKALAIAALKILGCSSTGTSRAFWPARFEVLPRARVPDESSLRQSPSCQLGTIKTTRSINTLPQPGYFWDRLWSQFWGLDRRQVVMDGAHNEAALHRLLDMCRDWSAPSLTLTHQP